MRTGRFFALAFTLAGLPIAARATPYLFDLGTRESAVAEGFTAITDAARFDEHLPYGWRAPEHLEASANRLPAAGANVSNTRPPIWTNAITEDAISSPSENTFCIAAPPGDYQLYVVCGTSQPAARDQYYDFTVCAGDASQAVQIDGPYQYRIVRMQAHVGSGPLTVRFSPRTKWVCNAILAWTSSEEAEVARKIIAPFEDWTFRLPPDEAKKWVRDPEPPGGELPELTPAEVAQGFVEYGRHCLTPIYPHTKPLRAEIGAGIRISAAPGQSVAGNFIVLPLQDLTGARVRVGDIGPLASSAIDVRHVRYMEARPNYDVFNRTRIVPDLLERFETLSLRRDENSRFWLTFHVPADAAPGRYAGEAVFESSAGAAHVPIELQILPIRLLEDPTRLFSIYYQHPLDRAFNAKDEGSRAYFRRKADLEHRDMAAHGIHNTVLSVWTPPADAQGKFNFHWELFAEKMALWHKYGFHGPIVMEINTADEYQKYTGEELAGHSRGVRQPPAGFAREITAMVREMEAERKRRGWPEFIYYPFDEPGRDDASVNFIRTALQACKAAGPGVRTYLTADPTLAAFAPLRPFVDVWCTQPFAPDRETVLADGKARGVEYWCYPNHVNGECDHTPLAGARMTYGFGFWRSGFRALIPWIYSASTGDPFNYLDGAAMDFFNRSEPDGTPIPAALWEAYREGYEDSRYLYTLETAIAEGRKHPETAPAAESAAAELKRLWNDIHVQPIYQYDGLWSGEEFDLRREKIAQQIVQLQAAISSASK